MQKKKRPPVIIIDVGGTPVNAAAFVPSAGGVYARPDRLFVPAADDPTFQALTRAVEAERRRD
jgi:hypothetical protein